MNLSSSKEFHRLKRPIQNMDLFIENNQRGNGMYQAALNQYGKYLLAQQDEQLVEDITEIMKAD